MTRKLFVLLVLLLGVLLPASLLAQGDSPTTAAYEWEEAWHGYPQVAGTEPNNTPAAAVPANVNNRLWGQVDGADAIDHFKFTGQSGDKIALVSYNADVTLSLLQPNLTALPLADLDPIDNDYAMLWATLPANGVYTVAVANNSDQTESYTIYLVRLTGSEPGNDTPATAIPATIGDVLTVSNDYPCDEDWYRFQGRAGDVIKADVVRDANGNPLSGEPVILPTDGVYFFEVDYNYFDDWYEDWGWHCDNITFGPTFPLGESMWVSAAVDKLGGNAAIKRGDIATRKTAAGQWQLVFDASDVGITANVDAIERLPNGDLLLSLAAAQSVAGLGQVMPQDIIRFTPTSLGETTAGAFAWFLDGSDVGLTTADENIDAISMQADVDHPLRISLSGAGNVPRQSGGALAVADEDVLNFVDTQWGANSAGNWRMSLDGSTIPGMAAEDVSALVGQASLVSFDSAFVVQGAKGNALSVFQIDRGVVVKKLTNVKIDGLAIGPAMP